MISPRLAGVAVGAALMFLTHPSGAAADDPVQEMIAALNAVRAERGLGPYALSPRLTATAQAHVDDLLAHGMLGHVGSDGSRLRQRLARAGYRAHWVGENWVVADTLEGAVAWWLGSRPHTANILHQHYTEVGIGHGPHPWGTLWVLNFGRPEGEISAAPAVEPLPAPAGTYVVRSGDTLLAIARRHDVALSVLVELNHIRQPDRIFVGQVLTLPGGSAPGDGPPAAAEAVEPPESGAPAAEPHPPPQPPSAELPSAHYTVVPGDTLAAVARRHGTTWEALAELNGLADPHRLRVGQRLRVPEAAPGAEVVSETPTRRHVVRAGDNLYRIGLRYGVSLQSLIQANGLIDANLLRVGQVLVIP